MILHFFFPVSLIFQKVAGKGGLYGQKVTVELLDYIAESRRFENTEQLRAAVMAWADEARRWFAQKGGEKEKIPL